MGNIAQIYSPYLYLKENGPRYLTAMIANSCFCLACLLATLTLRYFLTKENAKLEVAETIIGAVTDEDKVGGTELETTGAGGPTRFAQGFRYVL